MISRLDQQQSLSDVPSDPLALGTQNNMYIVVVIIMSICSNLGSEECSGGGGGDCGEGGEGGVGG